jgi:hypothetical protein
MREESNSGGNKRGAVDVLAERGSRYAPGSIFCWHLPEQAFLQHLERSRRSPIMQRRWTFGVIALAVLLWALLPGATSLAAQNPDR